MSADDIIVPDWPPPKGYSNGRVGVGRVVHVGGQIGWNKGTFPWRETDAERFLAQWGEALDNVIAVVKAAGGTATDIADMTVYVTSMDMYRSARTELGALWKARLGRHYPAMALVAVSALFEPEALVEIQAVAYIGES